MACIRWGELDGELGCYKPFWGSSADWKTVFKALCTWKILLNSVHNCEIEIPLKLVSCMPNRCASLR